MGGKGGVEWKAAGGGKGIDGGGVGWVSDVSVSSVSAIDCGDNGYSPPPPPPAPPTSACAIGVATSTLSRSPASAPTPSPPSSPPSPHCGCGAADPLSPCTPSTCDSLSHSSLAARSMRVTVRGTFRSAAILSRSTGYADVGRAPSTAAGGRLTEGQWLRAGRVSQGL